MSPGSRVLVAIDFSPCSAAALRRAARIAAWYRAPTTALHIVPPFTPPTRGPLGPLSPGFDLPSHTDYVQSAQRRWEEFSKHIGGASDLTFEVVVGNPRDQLIEVVRRDKPRLLVLGAHGRWDGYLGVGPVAAACVQRAATQVLVVRQPQAGPFRSIVACVDFTDTSLLALQAAAGIAAEAEATLHIVHAYTDPWRGIEPPQEILRNIPDFVRQYAQAVEQRMRDFCKPLSGELDWMKPVFHAVLARTHGEGINAFIAERGCDLAVLGAGPSSACATTCGVRPPSAWSGEPAARCSR